VEDFGFGGLKILDGSKGHKNAMEATCKIEMEEAQMICFRFFGSNFSMNLLAWEPKKMHWVHKNFAWNNTKQMWHREGS
jgi:hypothetical protein